MLVSFIDFHFHTSHHVVKKNQSITDSVLVTTKIFFNQTIGSLLKAKLYWLDWGVNHKHCPDKLVFEASLNTCITTFHHLLPFLGLFCRGQKLMRHDLLVCLMDGAGNGSLALIKAPRLAGFAHHNLRMDYAAVMWVTVFRNSEGKATAVHGKQRSWRRLQRNVAPHCVIRLWTVYRNSLLPIKRWFSHFNHPCHSFGLSSESKGECDDACAECMCARMHTSLCMWLSVPSYWPLVGEEH